MDKVSDGALRDILSCLSGNDAESKAIEELLARRAEDARQAADAALVEHILIPEHLDLVPVCCDKLVVECRLARRPPEPSIEERLREIGLEVTCTFNEDETFRSHTRPGVGLCVERDMMLVRPLREGESDA